MIRRRRKAGLDGVEKLLVDTQILVNQLVKENKSLKTTNDRLNKELDRVSGAWDEIKKLARSAPKKRPRR